MKAESEGSLHQEGRTCPVCGTKFFATADREFCPVCILNRAFGAESKATGESGSVSGLAANTEQADRGSIALIKRRTLLPESGEVTNKASPYSFAAEIANGTRPLGSDAGERCGSSLLPPAAG